MRIQATVKTAPNACEADEIVSFKCECRDSTDNKLLSA